MATTIYDVALLAGVSPGTVSNVLNARPNVRESTRTKVLAAVDKLGYRVNSTARTLRSGRTGIITVAIPELRLPYHADMTQRILHEAEQFGWGVLIEQTYEDPDRELQALTGDRRRLNDGLILTQPSAAVLRRWARPTSYPVVMLGSDPDADLDTVGIHNEEASALATRHLIEIGRRRIAYIGATPAGGDGYTAQRARGHRLALAEAGLVQDPRLSVEASRYRREEGAAAMAELLERAEPFDAVRCFNDAVALGALECLRERGVRVPEDVAVIGYDDVEEARHSTPTLSSVSPDRAVIARVAVQLLHDRLTGAAPEEPVRRVIAHHLEVRGSTSVVP